MKFTEKHRSGLTRMFRHMPAYSMSWDILWEVCLEQEADDVTKAMELLDIVAEPFEAISINAALRKAGYAHVIKSWKDK